LDSHFSYEHKRDIRLDGQRIGYAAHLIKSEAFLYSDPPACLHVTQFSEKMGRRYTRPSFGNEAPINARVDSDFTTGILDIDDHIAIHSQQEQHQKSVSPVLIAPS
jgi:hypothetical protein